MERIFKLILFWFSGLMAVAGEPRLPSGVELPLMIYDVDWSTQDVGHTPQRAAKEWTEEADRSPWQALPWRTYTHLDYVTRDRTAVVHESALGLSERPLLFSVADNRQPTWGPRMFFQIPHAIAAVGRRYRIGLEVSMGSIVHGGGVSIPDIGSLNFSRDGSLVFNRIEIGRYRPNTPFRVAFIVDTSNRTLSTRVDDGESVSVKWPEQRRFHGLRLDGLLPGGYAGAPLQLAFDNIKITLEE